MSNQKAFNERMEELVEELRSKESELAAKVSENQRLIVDCERLKEETNMYKGRCTNLQRDVQVSQSYLQKVSSDNTSQNDQFNYMKERVKNLEGDLERAIREKTDAACEVRRLTQANEQIERSL